MSAPQEKHVVVAVKTFSPLAASSAAVAKAPVVKKAPVVMKKPSGPTSSVPKKVVPLLAKKPISGANVAPKRKPEGKPSSGAPAVKKTKVVTTSGAVVKKPVKKIAGDSCMLNEERSDDGSDSGADIKDFLIDDDDDEDGYSSEEEAKKVEARSFHSVEKYKQEMAKVKALLGSRETRNKFLKENPDIFKEDLN